MNVRTGGRPEGRGEGLAEELTDGIVVLDGDGLIEWVNPAMATLVGAEPDTLIGASGLDFVHPDDLAGSRANMRVALRHPERTTVIPYRLRRSDGTDISVELRSSRIERADGTRIALVIRDRSARAALTEVLRAVAAGGSLDDVFAAAVRMIRIRWPGSGTLFSHRPDDPDAPAGCDVLVDGAPPALVAHLARAEGPLPWVDPPEDPSRPGLVDVAALPVDVRASASAAGFTTCTAAEIPDPGGDPARFVVWFREDDVARDDYLPASRELVELIGLAVDRRRRLLQLTHIARHDSLTGLLNRDGFLRRLRDLLGTARASADELAVLLLYVDLDGLKAVNDRDGHSAGDVVLVDAARRLRDVVAADDVLGRLGGDEFAVARLVDRRGSGATGADLAAAIAGGLAPDGAPEGSDRPTASAHGASVGLVIDDGRGTAETLIDAADAAMYRAKSAGRGRWSR